MLGSRGIAAQALTDNVEVKYELLASVDDGGIFCRGVIYSKIEIGSEKRERRAGKR